jgi:hypothetical protein
MTGRERHRRAGVARVRLLHGVHRQGADRVDREAIVGVRACVLAHVRRVRERFASLSCSLRFEGELLGAL